MESARWCFANDFRYGPWVTKAVMEFLAPRLFVAGAIPALGLSPAGAMAANGGVFVDAAYPALRVLIAQQYGELKMTDVSMAQAVRGIPVPAAFAKSAVDDAAMANFCEGGTASWTLG
jgi:hypothetical protein